MTLDELEAAIRVELEPGTDVYANEDYDYCAVKTDTYFALVCLPGAKVLNEPEHLLPDNLAVVDTPDEVREVLRAWGCLGT